MHGNAFQRASSVSLVPADKLNKPIPIRALYAVALAVLYSLIVLFRSEDFDGDFFNYEAVYYGYIDSDFEFGFNAIFALGQMLGVPVTAWLALLAFPGLVIKFLLGGRTDGTSLFVFTALFSSSFFLLHELNQARLAFAVAFALLAAWIRQDRPIWAVLLIFIGSSFHYSVLILLPALLGLLPTGIFFGILAAFQYFVGATGIGADVVLGFFPSFLSESDRIRGYTVETLSIQSTGFVVTLSVAFLAFQLVVAFIFEKTYMRSGDYDSLLVVARRTAIIAIPVFIVFIGSPVLANRLAEAHRFFLLFYLAPVISKALAGKGIDPLAAGLFLIVIVVGNLYIYGGSVFPLYAALEQIGLVRSLGIQ